MSVQTVPVIVTGALGWLGSRLTEALVHGLPDHSGARTTLQPSRVRCLVLPEQDASRLRLFSDLVDIVPGDLRNPEDCRRLFEATSGAIVFHTAGIIHPRKVSEFYQTNVEGTRNLLGAARAAHARRVVIMSSNSPCGCNPHPDHLFDELSPYRPYMNYGKSKMKMEQLVNRVFQEAQAAHESFETVIIRAPWFYGPNQPPRQTLFFRMIRDGKAPIVGHGENLRSMSYVDNLCQGLLLAATVERAGGQTYWLADQRPYSMNEIVDTVERLLETEFGQKCAHKRLRLPALASSAAYAADFAFQGLGIYHQKIHVLSEMNKTIACSIAKAERELGYKPAIALEEGMRRSLEWCVSEGITL